MQYELYEFPFELWIVRPRWEIALKIATFVPVLALGIVGNWTLLVIIARNRSLRTPTNLLLANMSAADLLTLCICPVMFLFNNFYQDFRLGQIGCLAEGFLEGAFLVAGVLNLCAVSYDRLTAIVLPAETRITVRAAKMLMVATWLAGAALAAPFSVFRFYRERQWLNYLETFCSENPDVLPTYWHFLIATIVWLPLTVMVLCYTAILWKLDRYEAQVLRREHPICVSYKTRVAKIMFAVVLTFVALRVPFTVLVFARHHMLAKSEQEIDQAGGSFSVLWYIAHYLIFVHAAVNPLIYGLSNDNFRRAYSQTPVFCGWRWRRHQEHNQRRRKSTKVRPQGVPNAVAVTAESAKTGTTIAGKLQPRSPTGTIGGKSDAVRTPWKLLRSMDGLSASLMGSPLASKATIVTHIRWPADETDAAVSTVGKNNQMRCGE